MVRGLLLILVLTSCCGCGGKVGDAESSVANVGGSHNAAAGGTNANGGAMTLAGGTENVAAAGTQAGVAGTGPVKLIPIAVTQYQDITLAACNGYFVETERSTTDLVWVVDASSSMAESAAGYAQSKWSLAKNAILNAIEAVHGAQGCASLNRSGLFVYPGWATDDPGTIPPRPCINSPAYLAPTVPTSTDAIDVTLLAKLLDSTTPRGNTPTLDAYQLAVQNSLSTGPVRNFIVLVTDGMPSVDAGCKVMDPNSPVAQFWALTSSNDNVVAPVEPIITAIAQAYNSHGISTFVVGTPGSESARSWLSRAAVSGNTQPNGCDQSGNGPPYCHFDMTSNLDAPSLIAEATSNITMSLISCQFTVPSSGYGNAPIDPMLTLPMILGSDGQIWAVPLDQGPAEACTEGFRILGSGDATMIELCPASCARLQNDCEASLAVAFNCKGSLILP